MIFWVLASALTLVSILVLARALWRGHDTVGSRAARLGVYRHRLRELDDEFAAGKIGELQHADARRELEDAALDDIESASASDDRDGRPVGALVLVTVVVPAVAFTLYQALGTPRTAPAPELPTLIAELDARLAESPDDLQGWMLLGRSRVVLGDFSGAVDAWRHAQRLSPDDPTVLANLGEALVLTDSAQLTGEAAWMFDAVIATDPQNPKALWYGGLVAEARGDDALATERWRMLLTLEPPEVLRNVLERRLAAMATGAFRLDIEIELGEGASPPPEEGVLFVTAHTTDSKGTPPIAATRVPLAAWPVRVTLTDADVMLPGASLTEHDALRIVARVSASNSTMRVRGDAIGTGVWHRGDAAVRIVLDEVVE
ncbi:MAG: c-type cytochrome biogenesis protein CcmI [Gammaproteobacteria bacterium]